MRTGQARGKPDKACQEELAGKGSSFTDTPSESDGRDKAKVESCAVVRAQK